MSSTIEIRPLDPEMDAESLLATWAEVFGSTRSRAEWEWQTIANPAGTRVFVAVSEGRVVAQYAGVPLRVWIDGREHIFTQSVDSMVHPDFRKGLKRPGLFVELAKQYFDHYGVHGEDTVHYGWPLEAAWRIGRRFLKYECVREEVVLVRELTALGEASSSVEASHAEVASCEASGSKAPRRTEEVGADANALKIELVQPVGDELRWLYERCCGAWGASAVRDAAFYAWRFGAHPSTDYQMLGARDADGVLRGLAVLRLGDWLEAGSRALCDWLVPADEPEVARQLETAIRSAATRDGGQRLVSMIPEWSPSFLRFQEWGWRVHPAPYRLTGRCFDRALDQLFLREHWWMTLADSDLA